MASINKWIVFVYSLVIFSILGVFYITRTDTKPIIFPSPQNSPKLIKHNYSVWTAWWDEDSAIKSLNGDAGNVISTVMPTWYALDDTGNFSLNQPQNKDGLNIILKKNKIRIMPSISNSTKDGFNPKSVSLLVNSDKKILEQIDFLISEADNYGFYGFDLDLEEISKKDKDAYTQFVKIFAEKLHQNKKMLSVTVHAKEGVDDDWEGTLGQDLVSLGKYADEIRVMAYDFHSSPGDPGAITPKDNLINSINYIIENVPKEKINICLPTYGYDWGKSNVQPYQYNDMQNLVNQNNIKILRDNSSSELWGTYYKDSEKHTVWFQDYQSTVDKIQVVKKAGIDRICFWRLGGEDPRIWKELD